MNKSFGFTLFLFCLGFMACDDYFNGLNSGFRIRFSDGTIFHEKDIEFYDTSSHMIFLKDEIHVSKDVKDFDVLVGRENIYHGVVFPSYMSSMPTETVFISDIDLNDNAIIHLNSYTFQEDFRNDPRIINALRKSNKIHYGLDCTIDKIEVSASGDHSAVNCTITVKNNDNFSYYIIDPMKMGNIDFNYYTGGLFFNNMETKVSSFLIWSSPNPDYNNLTMDDFSILKGGQKVQYTFYSDDYYKMEPGIYNASFRFAGYREYFNTSDLVKPNGTIWVGSLYSTLNGIVVN
ncbi:MAG: hypothetical protein U0W24_07520 [Bacteroidales bacterium]